MGTRIDPDGMDLEWFALDRDGHLGYFTSGGSRVIPEPILESESEREQLRQRVVALPAIGKGSRAWLVSGIMDSWVNMAQRGLFGFDFVSHDNNYFEQGHYRRMATPSRPLLAESLDDTFRKALGRVTLDTVCFAKARIPKKELLR